MASDAATSLFSSLFFIFHAILAVLCDGMDTSMRSGMWWIRCYASGRTVMVRSASTKEIVIFRFFLSLLFLFYLLTSDA
jgi:hypothetical protein